MRNPEEIITDAEIIRVHGYANFGDMTPREVVNEGVKRYAVGFTSGHTQMCILREHGLIRKPKPGSYSAVLTAKGKAYARSIWWTHFKTRTPTLADVLAVPEIAALVEAASQLSRAVDSSFYPENRGGYETVEQMREVHAKEREVAIQTYVGARDAEEALAMSHRSALSVIRGGAKARINDMLTDLNTTLTAINNKV